VKIIFCYWGDREKKEISFPAPSRIEAQGMPDGAAQIRVWLLSKAALSGFF
jgi:hypothetical protein